MRIVALVKRLDHVCCRYRLAAYQPFLSQAGCTLELLRWSPTWLARFFFQRAVGQADVLIVQRRLLSARQLSWLRPQARVLLYDFDDAIFWPDSFASQSTSHARQQRFAETVQCVDGVIAGNTFLAEQASLRTDLHKIQVIPTCVDLAKYPLARHRSVRSQLVWIGSRSTLQALAQSQALLEEVGQAMPGLQLKLICDRFLQLGHIEVVPCHWTQATEAAELASADIGLSWLPDDLWSRGKCCLKVLQYMAAGLPVIANPVGMQAQLVRHGETGLLVRNAAELREAIRCLAHDPGLRSRMGEAGRALVQQRFQVQHGAGLWLELLRKHVRLHAHTELPCRMKPGDRMLFQQEGTR